MKTYPQTIVGIPSKKKTINLDTRTVWHEKPLSSFGKRLVAFRKAVHKQFPNAININSSTITSHQRIKLRKELKSKFNL